jgi:hypothetical protein
MLLAMSREILMWFKIAEDRLCSNCEVPIEHWVLYGQSGRIVGEATFCPICYPDVRGVFSRSEEDALETSRAIHVSHAA